MITNEGAVRQPKRGVRARAAAIVVALYVGGVMSCVIGSHLFLVVYDPRSVGGLYLFPASMIAPAELLGLIPALMGKRWIRRWPGAAWRLVVGTCLYVAVLTIATYYLERRNVGEPMLWFVLLLLRSPEFLLASWGLFLDAGRGMVGNVGVALAAILPLLVVLFVTCRSAESASPL